jgi:hypothetical protein
LTERLLRALVPLLLVLAVGGCGASLPKDDDLLERFSQYRGELETLIRMFEADKGLGRVGQDFMRPADPRRVGVSSERIREYRRLCEAIGAPACIEGYDAEFDRLYDADEPGRSERKDPIWIHVAARGLSISGSSEGFIYSAAPPFSVVADLDVVSPRRSGTWVRHIQGAWYLYFDYED